MRKLFFFLLALNTTSAVAQKSNTPPPPPPPPYIDTVITTAEEVNDSNRVYDIVAIQEMPKFPGGDTALLSFLRNNIAYPKVPRDNGVQGKVFIAFIIDKPGDVTDIALYRGAPTPKSVLERYSKDEKYLASYKAMTKELDDEALRVVRMMPKWSPGLQNGKPVKTRFILPINFQLQ